MNWNVIYVWCLDLVDLDKKLSRVFTRISMSLVLLRMALHPILYSLIGYVKWVLMWQNKQILCCDILCVENNTPIPFL